ncbi:MAG: beta-glucosidase [Thermoleophilaceae bacterium]|nr:beta-glucosidase [Thermoleophilaceae bacterium]
MATVLLAIVSVAAAVGVPRASAQAPTACAAWMDAKKSPDERAHALVAKMSIDDKIQMVHQADPIWSHFGAAGYIPGNPALCIPDLVLNDAGQGVGDQEYNTTAFPSAIAQASSWDRTLQRKLGKAIGHEAWQKGINVQLAPDVNIARFPMNGRNSEAFGEDPYFSGQTATAEIKGIQDNPVIATVKHYALNNHEVNRMTVSSDATPRTIHEIYTPAFEAAVKQGHTGSVMSSYNRINGTYASENGPMLNGILKTEFGFDGFSMTDWGGQHSTVESALAGNDMEMDLAPGKYYADALKTAVQQGKVPQARLDDMVLRITRTMFRIGIFEHPAAAQPAAYGANVETPDDVALARKVAEEGTVLLKNAGNALPITGQGKRVAVIGAQGGQAGANESYNTGGSAHIPETGPHPHVISPLQGITQRGSADNDVVTYADGSSQADAIAAASAADIAVVFVGDGESEGTDRPDLKLSSAKFCTLAGCAPPTSDQDALIKAVAAANPNTVVVLDTGGPMLMPWLAQVKSVLQAWFPGQEDGNAIASLLFGDANPSAKLVQTFPKAMADLPIKTPSQYPGVNDSKGVPHAAYSEGLKVGYRWYDSQGIQPLFPFGFGLSYTTFAISGMHVKAISGSAGGAIIGAAVKNTGTRQGAEVAQLYVGMPPAAGEPPKQLKSYAKVALEPGQSKTVTMRLDRRAFSYWSTGTGWTVAKGCYTLMLGSSSRDIAATKVVSVGGAKCPGAAATIARPATRCVDARRFAFKLHHAVGARIVRVVVFVNGRKKLALRGHDIKRVTIARLPRKRFVVRIETTSSTGAQLISTRVYHGCKKTRPRTHARHPH